QKALRLPHRDELAFAALALLVRSRRLLGARPVLGRLGGARHLLGVVVVHVVLGFVVERIVFHFPQGLCRAASSPSLVLRNSIPRAERARAASSSPRASASRCIRVTIVISAATRSSSSRMASLRRRLEGFSTSVRPPS